MMYVYGMRTEKMPEQYYRKVESITGAYQGLIVEKDALPTAEINACELDLIGQVKDLQYWRNAT